MGKLDKSKFGGTSQIISGEQTSNLSLFYWAREQVAPPPPPPRALLVSRYVPPIRCLPRTCKAETRLSTKIKACWLRLILREAATFIDGFVPRVYSKNCKPCSELRKKVFHGFIRNKTQTAVINMRYIRWNDISLNVSFYFKRSSGVIVNDKV